jgi:DNA-binding MarR family transcriptional regulator
LLHDRSPSREAEIRPAALFCRQLMSTTAYAASDATRAVAPNKPICKPRANCLNPKEIAKLSPFARPDALTYSSHQPLFPSGPPKSSCRNDRIMNLDSETKAVELPNEHADELRLWLRLLTCTTLIEGEVRSRLRERFDVTLPRFDLMAQLDKAPEGMTLSDVSKRMMVSNGNVTGLVERLVESGHLDRRTSDSDRRVQVIRLTKAGHGEFRKMAAEHETWIADIFGDLAPKDVRELMRLLAKTKASAQKSAQARA